MAAAAAAVVVSAVAEPSVVASAEVQAGFWLSPVAEFVGTATAAEADPIVR